jgi:hypothetical protein
MSAIWDDLKAAGQDAWHGNGMLGDLAATGIDTVNAFLPVLPEGKDVKKDIDGFQTDMGAPQQNPNGGNLGNEIGTVAGGAFGLMGGPLGAVAGMQAGSQLGGFIADQF